MSLIFVHLFYFFYPFEFCWLPIWRNVTRAGALAGVGLALDPEGNKRVLIQPSSFEKNTLNVTFLDFLAAEVQLIMIFRFSLGYVRVFGNRQISSLEKYINRS